MSVIEANTGLEVNYDKTSVYRIGPLSVIEANTGLEVNYDKTSVYRIGPLSVIEANTGLEVNYDKTSVYRISPLSVIEANAGLEVNYDKTSIYRTGSLAGTDTKTRFNWTNDDILILGIVESTDTNSMLENNYGSVVNKTESVATLWYNRSLNFIW